MASYPNRCQHLKVNGTQCGSPALRRNRFCFFHKRFQDERIRLATDRKRRGIASFILPVLEDANSIQMALQQVMRLLISRDIDHKTASLLLYALQTASSNLRQTKFEAYKHEIILDPRDAANTALDDNAWEDEDFEEEEDDPETTRIEEEAENAAQRVRDKYRNAKLEQQQMTNFYAKYPQYRPANESSSTPSNASQPTELMLTKAAVSTSSPDAAKPALTPAAAKKPPLPTNDPASSSPQADIHGHGR